MHDFDVRTFPERRQDILELLVGLWEEWQPDVVFQPSHHDVHQDHQTIAQEGLRAFKRTTILGYEIPWNNFEFSYGCYVALERRHVERKVAAVAVLRVAAAPALRERGVHLEPRPRARHEREPRVRRGVPGLPRGRIGKIEGAPVARRFLDLVGLALCALGAACMLGALAVDLGSTSAKVLMALSAAFFVPGALLTLAWVRFRLGTPR